MENEVSIEIYMVTTKSARPRKPRGTREERVPSSTTCEEKTKGQWRRGLTWKEDQTDLCRNDCIRQQNSKERNDEAEEDGCENGENGGTGQGGRGLDDEQKGSSTLKQGSPLLEDPCIGEKLKRKSEEVEL